MQTEKRANLCFQSEHKAEGFFFQNKASCRTDKLRIMCLQSCGGPTYRLLVNIFIYNIKQSWWFIFYWRHISSRSVACISNTDVLIPVPVTSDLDVGRTGYSLSMPFRINVFSWKPVTPYLRIYFYNQKTNGSLSFPPAYPTLTHTLTQDASAASGLEIAIKRRVSFLICRLQHPSWARHSCTPSLFKLIHKCGISLSEGTEPRRSFRCFISK